ncbi:TPA: hypothetical protein DCW38_05430 [candidate division WOR-3 bacterium]|uniref:POTRA domain-containing protein n=1 Tax=candidate division WOR-3 bacterium TaxID=2052148 RepID=A0A350HAN9_UNCW3|nr:hypothetical protein [candidate division WOR-3 bacterium]
MLFVFLLSFTLLFSQESRVFFSGNEIVSENRINDIFIDKKIESGLQEILDIYLNSGYPFVEIVLDSTVKRGDGSFYYFTINENGRFNISGINNNSLVRNSFLNRAMNLKGMLFSDNLIRRRIQELESYDFIDNNMNYRVRQISDAEVEIGTEIGQKRSSHISGTLSSDFDSMMIAGFLDLAISSPFGFGDIYKLDYSRYSADKTNLEGEFEFPFVFSTPIGVFSKGSFISFDTTLSTADYTFGLFLIYRHFKIKTGFGKTTVFYPFAVDSNKDYSHISGEIAYRLKKDRAVEMNILNNLSENISTIFDMYSLWDSPMKRILLLSELKIHYVIADDYERQMGKYLGGNENLKSYPEDFILTSDFVFYEGRFLYNSLQNIKPGLSADASLYRTDKTERMNSFLYSYGLLLQAENDKTMLVLYYGLNPNLGVLQGRVHLTLSYFF